MCLAIAWEFCTNDNFYNLPSSPYTTDVIHLNFLLLQRTCSSQLQLTSLKKQAITCAEVHFTTLINFCFINTLPTYEKVRVNNFCCKYTIKSQAYRRFKDSSPSIENRGTGSTQVGQPLYIYTISSVLHS